MPNDFQVNFLNGLEMARSTQGAKLDAMQQAASMQYQISAKQMDFQMGLLKLRESQAAQAVEMRMAQDEHELEMKKNALMVEKFEMEKQVVSAKMEDDKLASAAGAALQMWQVGLRDEGIVPGSVNEFRATDQWLASGVKLSKDARVHTRAVAEYDARKTQMQETFFNNGLTYLNKINASRSVTVGGEETGVAMTDKMYGVGNEGELEVVLEQFKRGAELGHEPSQRMYARVQGLLEGVTAPAPGVKDAAKTATDTLRQEFIEPRAPGQAEGLKYPESSSAAIKQARMDWRSEDVALAGQYIEGARARLEEIQRQARASRSEADVAAAARAASALSDLEAAAKDDTGLPGFVTNSAIGRAFSLGGGAVYRQDTSAGAGREYETRIASPTLRQLENLPLAASPQALLDEISKIHQAVRSRRGLSREFVPY